MTKPFVSSSCEGEKCSVCGGEAHHKVSESIQWDDPLPCRHELTAYVCHLHFVQLMGSAAQDERDK